MFFGSNRGGKTMAVLRSFVAPVNWRGSTRSSCCAMFFREYRRNQSGSYMPCCLTLGPRLGRSCPDLPTSHRLLAADGVDMSLRKHSFHTLEFLTDWLSHFVGRVKVSKLTDLRWGRIQPHPHGSQVGP